MPVPGRDVSVVVQGPVGPWLGDVVDSVRRLLPDSQLILSTWQGSAVAELDVDDLVLSEDPGSTRTLIGPSEKAEGRFFNVNRMFRSTRTGLAHAEQPYTLKLRTDSILRSTEFLSWFGTFPGRQADASVFSERILCPSIAVRPADRTPEYLFHPSDCAHFGRTDDLHLLWDIPEIDEEAITTYWRGRTPPSQESKAGRTSYLRYVNEQLLWLGCLAKLGLDVGYEHFGDRSPGLADLSNLLLANNFLVLDPSDFGVDLVKLESIVRRFKVDWFLWFDDWLALEKRYCSGLGRGRVAA